MSSDDKIKAMQDEQRDMAQDLQDIWTEGALHAFNSLADYLSDEERGQLRLRILDGCPIRAPK